MGKLNNSDIDKVSGGVVTYQKNADGKFDVIVSNVIKTCKDENEAKEMINELADRGAIDYMSHHNKCGGVHVCPGKFECKHHHPR